MGDLFFCFLLNIIFSFVARIHCNHQRVFIFKIDLRKCHGIFSAKRPRLASSILSSPSIQYASTLAPLIPFNCRVEERQREEKMGGRRLQRQFRPPRFPLLPSSFSRPHWRQIEHHCSEARKKHRKASPLPPSPPQKNILMALVHAADFFTIPSLFRTTNLSGFFLQTQNDEVAHGKRYAWKKP